MKAVVVLALAVALAGGCGSGAGSPSPLSSPAPIGSSVGAAAAGATSGAPEATPGPVASDADASNSPNGLWLDRAAAVIDALGYEPSDDGTVTGTTDSDTGVPITRVEYRDGWSLAWDASARLVQAFRQVIPEQDTKPLARDEAVRRIGVFAAALGFVPPGGAKSAVPVADGGWQAGWPRSVDDVPVLGDGAWITLHSDGTFLGFLRLEHALAPKPVRVLTRSQAEAALLAASKGVRPSALGPIARAELMWAPPSAPGGVGAPPTTFVLCWVLYREELHVSDTHTDWSRTFTDAGTGRVLWSDSTA